MPWENHGMMSPFRIPPVPYRIHYGTRIPNPLMFERFTLQPEIKNDIDGRSFDVKNPDLKKPVKAP